MTDITRKRGDTVPIELEVTDDDGAVDISGFSFTLTVDPESRPTDDSNNLFALTGTITDAESGLVEFPVTEDQADNVGRFFYDIEQVDASSKKLTIASGKFTFNQDITK